MSTVRSSMTTHSVPALSDMSNGMTEVLVTVLNLNEPIDHRSQDRLTNKLET